MAEASAQHARTSYTVQSLIYWACKRPTQKCVNRWELDKQAANVVHYPTTSVVLFVGSCFDEWKTQDQLCLVRLVLLDHSSLCKTPGPVCQQLMPVQLHHFLIMCGKLLRRTMMWQEAASTIAVAVVSRSHDYSV